MKSWKRATFGLVILAMICCGMTGCSEKESTQNRKVEEEEFIPVVIGTYEAEDGEFTGSVHTQTDKSK